MIELNLGTLELHKVHSACNIYSELSELCMSSEVHSKDSGANIMDSDHINALDMALTI